MEIILQCPRCLNVRTWDRAADSAPGSCFCKSKRPWNALKEKPKHGRGFVIVHSSEGSQKLRGPSWLEDKDGWVK